MVKVEVHEFIAVEKVNGIIYAFSNKPYCEYAYSDDEGAHWVTGKISRYEDERITSPWQVGIDELGYLYLGTSRGNIYRLQIGLDWSLVNDVSFSDDDLVKYIKVVSDGTIFVASEKGNCIMSRDRGITWGFLEPPSKSDGLVWCNCE